MKDEGLISSPVGESLFSDWHSRGIVFTLEQAGSFTHRKQGRQVWITTTPAILLGLIEDAEWLCDPSMGQTAAFRSTCRKFIESARSA